MLLLTYLPTPGSSSVKVVNCVGVSEAKRRCGAHSTSQG